MTAGPAIRTAADSADIDYAAELIALSFDHLAANHYLVPRAEERLTRLRKFFFIMTEHAADGAGEVLLTEDGAGVAVWFDRTGAPTEPVDAESRISAAAGPFIDRFAELDELFAKNHPSEPHWHLQFLAVHPDRWGHGLGSRLLAHTHARLDALQLPAYLESSDLHSRRLYGRHGYADMAPSVIALSDGTPFYRMWRRPASAGWRAGPS